MFNNLLSLFGMSLIIALIVKLIEIFYIRSRAIFFMGEGGKGWDDLIGFIGVGFLFSYLIIKLLGI